jgi:hypothetical protein
MPLFPPNAMRELAIPSPFAYCSAATVERLPLPMVMTVRPVDTYGFAPIGGRPVSYIRIRLRYGSYTGRIGKPYLILGLRFCDPQTSGRQIHGRAFCS